MIEIGRLVSCYSAPLVWSSLRENHQAGVWSRRPSPDDRDKEERV
jgi:hypothetical protein